MPESNWTTEELETRLRRPERGENGCRAGAEPLSRLDALALLCRRAPPRRSPAGGINTHVHTNKSFGYFASPSEAVWRARQAGIDIFGINDHYTTAGHEEFGAACRIAGIEPMFSMEAVAIWKEAEAASATVNDPANPGRTYLTAKGVTRPLAPASRGATDLRAMIRALERRNREITTRLAALIAERLGDAAALSWEQVLRLTPHDQPTERHICQAAAEYLERRWPERAARQSAVESLLGEPIDPAVLDSAAAFQNHLRSRLVKAGRPAYVPESSEAFIPLPRMAALALDLGAVPTYPVLGNPVTPWEEDIDRLLDRLEALGIYALEVIPDRNERERLQQIVRAADARGWPVLNGTEHNTRSPAPLIDRFFFDPEFRPLFERGARVILAHQMRRAAGEEGYVREDGALPPGDRRQRLRRLEAHALAAISASEAAGRARDAGGSGGAPRPAQAR